MLVYRIFLSNEELYVGSCEDYRVWYDMIKNKIYADFSIVEESIPTEYRKYKWEILERYISSDKLNERVNHWKHLLKWAGGYKIHE